MSRTFFMTAGVLGFLGVAGGAFGAHALRGTIEPELLSAFEVGVRYQMYHVFALAFAAWAFDRYQRPEFVRAGWLFVFGVAVFSGSLYIMSFTGMRWLGAVTPLGGLSFLAGWVFLILGFWKHI